MPTLAEMQADFRRCIAGEAPKRLLDALCADKFSAAERLSIYRNNSLITLERVLAAVFPVVRRLVDPRFFAYAADLFIREHLPTEPCLSEYGLEFPYFLRDFPPASGLAYLADVGGLEWAIHRVGLAASIVALPISILAEYGEEAAGVRLRVHPATAYLWSPHPIDLIWEMNQPDREPENIVPGSSSFYFEIRGSGAISIRRLLAPSWTFRSLLASGSTLGQAAEAALSLDADFQLGGEITAIFDDGLIAGSLPHH
jgi:hypothetical protein